MTVLYPKSCHIPNVPHTYTVPTQSNKKYHPNHKGGISDRGVTIILSKGCKKISIDSEREETMNAVCVSLHTQHLQQVSHQCCSTVKYVV